MKVITTLNNTNWLVTDQFIQKEFSDRKIAMDDSGVIERLCELSESDYNAERLLEQLDKGHIRNVRSLGIREDSILPAVFEHESEEHPGWYVVSAIETVSPESNNGCSISTFPEDDYGGINIFHKDHPNIVIEEICTDPGTSYGPYNVVDRNLTTDTTLGIGATVSTMEDAKLKAESLITHGFPEPLPRWSKDGVIEVPTALGYTLSIVASGYAIQDDQGQVNRGFFYDDTGNNRIDTGERFFIEDNLGAFVDLRDDPEYTMHHTNLKDLRRVNEVQKSWGDHYLLPDETKQSGLKIIRDAVDPLDQVSYRMFDQLKGDRFTYTLMKANIPDHGNYETHEGFPDAGAILQVYDQTTDQRIRVGLDSVYDIKDLDYIDRHFAHNINLDDFANVKKLEVSGTYHQVASRFMNTIRQEPHRLIDVHDRESFDHQLQSLSEGDVLRWHQPNGQTPDSQHGGYETLMVRYDVLPIMRDAQTMNSVNSGEDIDPGIKDGRSFSVGKEKCYQVVTTKGLKSRVSTSIDPNFRDSTGDFCSGVDPDKISDNVRKLFVNLPYDLTEKNPHTLEGDGVSRRSPIPLSEDKTKVCVSQRKPMEKSMAESAIITLNDQNEKVIKGIDSKNNHQHKMSTPDLSV